MADPRAHPRPLTLDEYRALEAASPERHEYVDGQVYALAGASRRHNRIVLNIARRLADAAGDGPCRVYVEAVRVRAAERVYYYPDVVGACGPPGDAHEEDAPCLVVEVLSPATEATDLREKALVYRAMPGLLAYLVVHQDRRWVQRHVREGDGWRTTTHVLEHERIPVPCPAAELTIAQLYDGVEREGNSDAPPLRQVHERAH